MLVFMESIASESYFVHFNERAYQSLNEHLNTYGYSMVFVLVDSNTHGHCLARFLANVETALAIEVIEIEAGEEYKTITVCEDVWNSLSELGADRKSLLINVGGGVVTDLGGFVASTFKRGINYINVPTSLLAMVDASVGGKTGVDLGTLKNQIGVINHAQMVVVDTEFLKSLPLEQRRSGLAEMLKHGLIQDQEYWQAMKQWDLKDLVSLDPLIHRSVAIKNLVVTEDLHEDGLRKTLNYGHTLGHAIESYLLDNEHRKPLLHGDAIAIGMVLATYISSRLLSFPEEKLDDISKALISIYGKESFGSADIEEVLSLTKYDKKNSHGNINFVLLEDIGEPVIDKRVDTKLIFEAFDYYATL